MATIEYCIMRCFTTREEFGWKRSSLVESLVKYILVLKWGFFIY